MNINRKLIGLDYDDTIAMSSLSMMDYLNGETGKNYTMKDVKGGRVDLDNMYGSIDWKSPELMKHYINADFYPNFIEFINSSIDLGYEFVIVTARTDDNVESARAKLEEAGISIPIYNTNNKSKKEIIKELGCRFFIDDYVEVLKNEIPDGCIGIAFGQEYNKKIERRLEDWYDAKKFLEFLVYADRYMENKNKK